MVANSSVVVVVSLTSAAASTSGLVSTSLFAVVNVVISTTVVAAALTGVAVVVREARLRENHFVRKKALSFASISTYLVLDSLMVPFESAVTTTVSAVVPLFAVVRLTPKSLPSPLSPQMAAQHLDEARMTSLKLVPTEQ